jgi:predicted phage terminase large subunit-like protein
VIAGKNTEMEVGTAHGGFRFATSVGGTLTGRGGNFIIIDDPMNSLDAMSRLARQHVWEWFTGTVGSRLDNKNEGAIVVVMQRLHVDDLAGRLLDHGGWHHLCLSAIAETEQSIPIGRNHYYVRKPGDVLDPARETYERLQDIRRDIGSANFEAQYQQQPVPEEGGLIQWKWFKTYDREPSLEPGSYLVMSWDTAMKDREVNDYTVGIRAIVKPGKQVYIVDVVRERMDFPTIRKRIIEEKNRHRGLFTLIEDAGSGTSLLQDLRKVPGLKGIRPVGEKGLRFHGITPMIEAGHVHLPAQAPWLEAFKREVLSFPASANDDQVDALSQLLNWLHRTYRGPLQGRYKYSTR